MLGKGGSTAAWPPVASSSIATQTLKFGEFGWVIKVSIGLSPQFTGDQALKLDDRLLRLAIAIAEIVILRSRPAKLIWPDRSSQVA
jgi:hypothetical protein